MYLIGGWVDPTGEAFLLAPEGSILSLRPLQFHNQLITTLLIGGVKNMAGHSVISHKAIKTYGDLPPLLL
jgi:hypothetical protein